MSALLKLRDYQTEAIAELHRRWDAGDTRVPMVLATGLGKTVIFAHLIADWVRTHVRKRVLVLVHTDELVQQAYKKIKDVAPKLHVGIVKAERNEVAARVIVASVQSLRSAKRRQQIRNVGLIIVDECHHATAATYRAILEHYGAFPDEKRCKDSECYGGCYAEDPIVQVAGFTATLARGDKQKLSDIWQECTFQKGIAFGIRRGYLLDVRGKRIVIPDMDLGNVRKSGGDYAEGSLAAELDRSLAPSIVAAAYLEHAGNRKGLGFAPTVESAHHFSEAFTDAGVASAVVHGGTPREERRLILKRLSAGDVQVVWNCGVLTEGFDEPTVSCIVMARPTKSAPLYQQIIGRGLRPDLARPADERGDCLVLDVVGASGRHDLRTLVDLSERAPADIEMQDGESLLELEEALDALEEAEEVGNEQLTRIDEYAGETVAQDFDPLNRTGIGAWLRTEGGIYFLPAGNQAYVLLVPSEEPNLWDVAWLTQAPGIRLSGEYEGRQGDLTEHRGLHLDMACSWAEEVLEQVGGEEGAGRADVRDRWRKSRAVATYRWQKLAISHGIEVTGKETRAELSDLIDTVLGTRRIDPIVSFMLAARDGMP
jgi:superfamily II DNA or RNA helicase